MITTKFEVQDGNVFVTETDDEKGTKEGLWICKADAVSIDNAIVGLHKVKEHLLTKGDKATKH